MDRRLVDRTTLERAYGLVGCRFLFAESEIALQTKQHMTDIQEPEVTSVITYLRINVTLRYPFPVGGAR